MATLMTPVVFNGRVHAVVLEQYHGLVGSVLVGSLVMCSV